MKMNDNKELWNFAHFDGKEIVIDDFIEDIESRYGNVSRDGSMCCFLIPNVNVVAVLVFWSSVIDVKFIPIFDFCDVSDYPLIDLLCSCNEDDNSSLYAECKKVKKNEFSITYYYTED